MNAFQQTLAILLMVSILSLGFAGEPQPLPPKAQKALKKYQTEIERLHDQLERKKQAAREKLEKSLATELESLIDSGDAEEAQAVEAELAKLREKPEATLLNERRELRKALSGQDYRWISGPTIWRFEADGTLTEGDKLHYWVAISGTQVLTIHGGGHFRVLEFRDENQSCRVRWLGAGQPGKGGGLVRME